MGWAGGGDEDGSGDDGGEEEYIRSTKYQFYVFHEGVNQAVLLPTDTCGDACET